MGWAQRANPKGHRPTLKEPETVINGVWGYACVQDGAVWIPAVMASEAWPLRRVLADLHKRTGLTRMIFSAVLDPEDFRPRLKHIVREWDQYVEEMEDYSHCIEVLYEEPPSPVEPAETTDAAPQPVDVRVGQR